MHCPAGGALSGRALVAGGRLLAAGALGGLLLAVTWLALAAPAVLPAGSLTIVAVGPPVNAVGVGPGAPITATFDGDVDAGSLTGSALVVQGSLNGRYSGTLTYDAPARTLTFSPARPFRTGELIRVTATDAIHSLAGDPLTPIQWQFTAGPRRPSCHGGFTAVGAGLPPVRWSDAAWGDYDGDGGLDIALSGLGGGGRLSQLFHNEGGAFALAPYDLPDLAFSDVSWGDYDNDGDLDLLLVGSGVGVSGGLWRNDTGAGGGFSATGFGLPSPQSGAADWGDFDNDGDLDLVIAGGSSPADVYRNDGVAFTPLGAGLPVASQGSVAWGDFDNDGDLDLLLTGYTSQGGRSDIYRNDGGLFAPLGAGLPGVGDSAVAWGDYDNDGDPDILLTGLDNNGGFTPISEIYTNDMGSFSPLGAGLPPVSSGAVAWGDFDNDGDLDILLAGDDSFVADVFRNDGGSFVPLAAGLPPIYDGSVAWGDYDDDGDLDILLTGFDFAGSVAELFRNDAACPPADLAITKTVTPTRLPAGGTLTYTLAFSNGGPELALGVMITDLIPAGLAVSGVISSGAALTPTGAGPPLAWRVADLPVGGGGLITITAVVDSGLPAGTLLANTAVITGANDPNPANNQAGPVVVTVTAVLHTSYLPVTAVTGPGGRWR